MRVAAHGAVAKRSLVLAALLTCGALSGVVGCAHLAQTSADIQAENAETIEAEVARDVEVVLRQDVNIPPSSISVNNINGSVTLTGTVDTILAKRRALEDARTVRGVSAVVDDITVDTPLVPDDIILENVRARLNEEAVTSRERIRVSNKHGVVELRGEVGAWDVRGIAERLAQQIMGVRLVQNELVVREKQARPDRDVAAEVASVLRDDVRIDASLINVQVERGVVRLSGWVGSDVERQQAGADAWVTGVRAVENPRLRVQTDLRDERRRLETPRISDADLLDNVVEAWRADERMHTSKPFIEVRSGEVTIGGTALDRSAKRAAEEDARNTQGVTSVRNEMTVPNAMKVETGQ